MACMIELMSYNNFPFKIVGSITVPTEVVGYLKGVSPAHNYYAVKVVGQNKSECTWRYLKMDDYEIYEEPEPVTVVRRCVLKSESGRYMSSYHYYSERKRPPDFHKWIESNEELWKLTLNTKGEIVD